MDNSDTLVDAVYCTPTIKKNLQIREHDHIQSNEDEKRTLRGKDEVVIFAWYRAYKQHFIDMMLQFKLMWDGHPGHITMSKHCI